MEQKVLQLINDVFGTKLADVSEEAYIEEILIWDSYMIMSLLVEIEMRYQRKTDLNRLFSVKTIGELVQLIVDTIG